MSPVMRKRQKPLTDEQWELIEPLLPPANAAARQTRPESQPRTGLVSRAFCGFCKRVWHGVFCRTSFPRPSTCWRRQHQWEDEGAKWDETFLDGSFTPEKRGSGCR